MVIGKIHAERYWSKVDRRGDEECWNWTAASSHGYGSLNINGRMVMATHIALSLAGKDIPAGKIVCHRCDNPSCVNPLHLWVGTQKDNIQDMWLKRRGYSHGRTVTCCPSGHEYTKENTRIYDGRRHCRACDRERNINNPSRAMAARDRDSRNRLRRKVIHG